MQKLKARALALLNRGIDKLQKTFPVNRVVVLLTPIVFVPASAWVTAYVAKHFPGLPAFSSGEVTGLMVAGALSALAAAYKWIDGWQKHEANLHHADPAGTVKAARR
jgi:hypothetical protein